MNSWAGKRAAGSRQGRGMVFVLHRGSLAERRFFEIREVPQKKIRVVKKLIQKEISPGIISQATGVSQEVVERVAMEISPKTPLARGR